MKSKSQSRSKRLALLAAGLFACLGLLLMLVRSWPDEGESDSKPVAGVSLSQGGKKSRERKSLSVFSERILAADWSKRTDLFREALRKKQVPLDELWATFQELDALPGEKFGLANLAVDLFAAYAEQDPAAGLANFESLNAGVVRRQALMGFASNLPAGYVSLLVDSVKNNGFPDEELAQIALQLHTAAKRYSSAELKSIIDSGYFDATAQQELTWMYEHKLSRTTNPIPPLNHESGASKTNSETDGVSLPNDVPEEDAGTKKEVSPSMAAFNSQLSRDRFGAANGLQRGVFSKEIVSPQLIKNVSRHLASEDPARALTWAGNWDEPGAKETAVESVVWSWIRSDPAQCTTAITAIDDRQVKDIAVAQVAEYLISHQSLEEATTWISDISDPALKKRSLELLTKARR